MPIDPEEFQQGARSSQDLAKAILDHEFNPPWGDDYPSMTFREELFANHGTKDEKKHGREVLWVLKTLEANISPTKKHKVDLRHGLQVIDAYRKEWIRNRDMEETRANPDRVSRRTTQETAQWFNRLMPPTEEQERDAQDSVGVCAATIGNLNAIEKVMRALARKLSITLIEPGRRK
jgi:hypothetical protein